MLQLAYLWVIILFSWNYVLSRRLTLQDCNLSFSCGDVNISYPFRLLNTTAVTLQEDYCGYPSHAINCTNGKPILTISNQLYFVRSINYTEQTLTVMDHEYIGKSCPRVHGNYIVNPGFSHVHTGTYNRLMKYYSNCSSYPPSSVPYISCLGSTGANRTYVFRQDPAPNFNWNQNCEERFEIQVLNITTNISNNVTAYDSILQQGFRIRWTQQFDCRSCEISGGKCGHDPYNDVVFCYCPTHTAVVDVNTDCNAHQGNRRTRSKIIAIGVSSGVGILILIMTLYIMYKRNMYFHCCQICQLKNRSKKNKNVEVFLEDYGRLAVHRYRYSELKKITNCFKDKLGQGGYGGVFKGKLKDGRLVAVKVLTESKGNGEEFINEVATIGKTNHINVVSLLGYCSEGPKRALMYEFMPNGSLEKFICNEKNTSATHPLGWEKLYQIALGIANGLEYLHCGCSTRILHFDIKPHNILLDKDFCPKISDFVLAKLCATRESTVSMLIARGTIGYIPPEVYCRNFGGVSSKSDVYSYEMLLLEMVGGKKNIDTTVYNTDSDDIYFPEWIYNHLEKHGNIGLGGFNEMSAEERKMIIVGLWSIQTHPVNRPSMTMGC